MCSARAGPPPRAAWGPRDGGRGPAGRAVHPLARVGLAATAIAMDVSDEPQLEAGVAAALLLLHAQRHTDDRRRDSVAWVDAIIAWTIRCGGLRRPAR